MNEHLSLWRRLRAYKLENNVYVLGMLVVATALSVLLYWKSDGEGFLANLWLAVATSLLASIFVMVSDIYVGYRSHENDIFLEGIERLGISNLHFNKRELLVSLMEGCTQRFWASGYRLILTAQLAPQISALSRQNVEMRFLCTAPWTEGYKLVYGEQDRVMDNYVRVLDAVLQQSPQPDHVVVRFTERPLFSDTYRVDEQLVTGPYMHNRDPYHGRLSANDFFTYELGKRSRLHELVEDEFITVWNDAEWELEWDRCREALEEIRSQDSTDQHKQELIRGACQLLDGASALRVHDLAVPTRG